MLSLPAPLSPTGLFPGVGDFRGCAVVSGRWAAEGCRCARCPARPFKLCFLNFGGVVAAPPLSAAGRPCLCPAFQMLWSHEPGGRGGRSGGRGDQR